MILRLLKAMILFYVLISVTGCDKDDPPGKDHEIIVPNYLLKTIEWENGMKAEFSYNDSLIADINYQFQTTSSITKFLWSGEKMNEMFSEESLYKNTYTYDNNGRLTVITNSSKSGTLSTSYTLEYTYQSNKLKTLEYFKINEAGKKLEASTAYQYDNSGDLYRAVTSSNGNVITNTITHWTPVVSFNPLTYAAVSLDENYTIYNYAVMSQTRRLPAKITRSIKIGATAEEVEKIEENTYTISDFRIDKVITAIKYPEMPNYNKTTEAVYKY